MRTLFLLPAVLGMTSCGALLGAIGDRIPDPETFTQTTAIHGTAPGDAHGLVLNLRADGALDRPVLASASVRADGSFTLPLPALVAVPGYVQTVEAGLLSESGDADCRQGRVSISDPETRVFTVRTLTAGDTSYVSRSVGIQTFPHDTSTDIFYTIHTGIWVYSTRPTRILGNFSCTVVRTGFSSQDHYEVNIFLKPGWNQTQWARSIKVLHSNVYNTEQWDTSSLLTSLPDMPSTWTADPASPVPMPPVAP